MPRRTSRPVTVGGIVIGGEAPVSVQTMLRTPVADTRACLEEIARALGAGSDLVRVAVASAADAGHFGRLAAQSPAPLIADTHFDWRTTVRSIAEGAAKVRINPGNMDPEGLRRVVDAAGAAGIPIRIGGNSGSIRHRRDGRGTPGQALAEEMAEEVLLWAARMEEMGFRDIVLSVKTPDAAGTVRANRIAGARSDHPLHLGVTAAGPREDAILKSAAALGSLLLDGLGDTIRLSFTGDLPGEVDAGVRLLRSLGLRHGGPIIRSCPGCGRCRVDLAGLVRAVKEGLRGLDAPLTVAVMGCEVNGPGEARDADLGIASAGGVIHLFVKGETLEQVPAEQAVARLVREAWRLAERLPHAPA